MTQDDDDDDDDDECSQVKSSFATELTHYIWSAGETLLQQVFGTGGIFYLVAIIS